MATKKPTHFFDGVKVVPEASPTLSEQGTLKYDSAADKLKVRKSASTDSVVLEASEQTLTNKTVGDELIFTETAEPATPAADSVAVYAADKNGITRVQVKGSDGSVTTLARDNFFIARNNTASAINKGQAVYVSGSTGTTPNIAPALATSETTAPALGVAAESIAAGGFGKILVYGLISDIDTSAFLEGDVLYLSASVAGSLTKTKPTHPNLVQRIGIVTNSGVGNGSFEVDTQSLQGQQTGTNSNSFAIGDAAAGAKSVEFKNGFTTTLQANPTANRTITLPDSTGTVALDADLTAHINDTTDAHDASAISVSAISGVTATDVQAAIAEHQADIDSLNTNKISTSEKGASSGVATLDASGKIPTAQLPALALTDVHVVANIAARDLLTVEEGDVAKVTDSGDGYSKAYIYDGTAWQELQTDAELTAHASTTTGVHGVTGAIVGTTDTQTLSSKTIVVANNTITTAASGNLAATELNTALAELQTDIDTRATSSALTTHTGATAAHGVTGSIVGTSDSQILSNKKFSDPLTVATQTTPTFESGYGKLYPKVDGKWYHVTTSGTEIEIGSGSGAGGINYITNPDAESNVNDWTAYNDSADTDGTGTLALLLADGTGGSVSTSTNLNFTRTSTAPLRETNSFLFQKLSGDQRGRGVATNFTIDNTDQGKVLQISFDYTISSGTYADNDVTIWVYDVTNARLIQPAPYQIKNTGTYEKFVATFQAASNSTSYRLIYHISSTSTVAYDLKFDNVSVGPQVTTQGAVVSDWVSITPTGTWTTNTTYTGRKRRVAGTVEYEVKIALAGAPTSTTLDINLGETISSTIAVDSFRNQLGTVLLRNATLGQSVAGTIVTNGTTSSVRVTYMNVTTSDAGVANDPTQMNSISGSGVPAAWTSGDTIEAKFSFPVQGWGSSQVLSSETDTRVVALDYAKSGTQAISAITWTFLTGFTKTTDTHGCFDITNNYAVIKVPGYYQIGMAITFDTAEEAILSYTINSATSTDSSTRRIGSGNTFTAAGSTLTPWLNAGDVIRWSVYVSTAANVTTQATRVQLHRLSGASQIAASEDVSMRYNTSSGASYTSGDYRLLTFATKEWDSHGSWNGTTYTAVTPGEFEVSCFLLGTGTAWAAGNIWALRIYKGGTADRLFGRKTFDAALTVNASVNGTTRIKLLAGETIDVRTFSSQNITLDSGALFNWVEIRRVGNY